VGNSGAPNYWSPRSAAQAAITAPANSVRAHKTQESAPRLIGVPGRFRDFEILGPLTGRLWRAGEAKGCLKPVIRQDARRERGNPVLKGSTISALETRHPIDTAPPVGEKMLLPRD
jgi:hypothetical protein